MIDKQTLSKPFYSLSIEETINSLDSSEDGLNQEEIGRRINIFGENILPESSKITKLQIIVNQFRSPIILVLILAGIITLFLNDYKSSFFIFIAVSINTILGFYQENKAETSLNNLKDYVKNRVRVIRDGTEIEVGAEDLVPGDLIRLLPGTRVPADSRLFIINDLSVNESILTGESLSVTNKTVERVVGDPIVADQKSMVFAGTLIEGGVGSAIVTSTGLNTELGKIAKAISKQEKEETPLQSALASFTLKASLIIGVLATILFIIGINVGYEASEMFLISVAVAVSAVPEGLPIAMTVILAVGVERLARRKGIVRKLLAAETLGSTTLILTDKTGTLTEAKMELVEIVSNQPKEEILEMALLNTDVIIENPDDGPETWRLIGRSLEAAIVRAAAKHKVLLPDIKNEIKVLEFSPFNSSQKFSASLIQKDSNKFWNYLGAPEILLEKLGGVKDKDKFLSKIDDLAYSGHRVLGVANGNVFVGLLAFRDSVRVGAKEAIKKVSEAGVRTVIVTGDHKGTAMALAKEVGIDVDSKEVLLGSEIHKMSDEELSEKLNSIKIFARVTPEDKLRITELYKTKGEIVAVTGDGVNDAPALKTADIGIAVGSGTDVAKGASDLIILDDNFETIVSAIEEGRRILFNLRKVIVYLLSNSLDELFLIGGALITGMALPLNALQILWVNFFSDSFPATALAFESGRDYLKTSPPNIKQRLFTPQIKFLILVVGSITSFLLFVMYAFLINLGFNTDTVRTFIFTSFSIYTLFLTLSIRNLNLSIFKYNFFSNKYLLLSILMGVALTLAAIYIPILQNLLGTVSLSTTWLMGVAAFTIFSIAIMEFGKSLFRN